MVNKLKFTKSDILRAIRGNPDAAAPVLPKDAKGNIDEIAAAFVKDDRLSSHGHIPTIAARLICSGQTVRNYINERARLYEYKSLKVLLARMRLAIKESDSGIYDLIREMETINHNDRFQLFDNLKQLKSILESDGAKFSPILAAIGKKIFNNTWGGLTKQAIEIQEAIKQEKEIGLIESAEIRHELKTDAETMAHILIKAGDGTMTKFILERLDKENYASRTEMTGAGGERLYDDDGQAALSKLAEVLQSIGKNPSEAILEIVQTLEAKISKSKRDGVDDKPTMERGGSGE